MAENHGSRQVNSGKYYQRKGQAIRKKAWPYKS